MKLLIAGSRDVSPSMHDLDDALAALASRHSALIGPDAITLVISGGARGVDDMGERWAGRRGIQVQRFLPDWRKHGRSAGVRRNAEMVAACDVALVVWDGSSPGTANTIGRLSTSGKPHHVVMWGLAPLMGG